MPEGLTYPATRKDLSREEKEVQQVAARFDYFAVHQGSVYLLMKRYTDPDDMPDVTPEECRNGLKMAAKAFPGGVFASSFADSPEEALKKVLVPRSFASPTPEQWARLTTVGITLSNLNPFAQHTVWIAAYKFYYQTFQDRIAGAIIEMEERPPLNPSFHWKTIEKSRVFGYDTLRIDFIPMSDTDRVVVAPYNAPLPRASFSVRDDITVPATDITDPAALSEQTKRFLDDKGEESHAVSLAQAIADLNKRAANSGVYGVDAMYAAKHVTLVGLDKLSPETAMKSLAGVYGLRVGHRDGTVTLTAPRPFQSQSFNEVKRALISVIPAPIYRAFRIHGTPAQSTDTSLGSSDPSVTPLSLDAYEARGAVIHNSVVRMFRYLAESQVKPRSGSGRTLSHLGERADSLFELARMARAYMGICGLVDCPPPPYLTDLTTFANRVALHGILEGSENTAMQLRLSLTCTDPKTGSKYGPVEFFDSPLLGAPQGRPQAGGAWQRQ